jgi:protein phosphatase 2C family protein 2/3
VLDTHYPVGRDTPESIPDIFGPPRAPVEFGGGGFRFAGAGGLANIASILGASGITFRTADDSDEEEEVHLVNSKSPENPVGPFSYSCDGRQIY